MKIMRRPPEGDRLQPMAPTSVLPLVASRFGRALLCVSLFSLLVGGGLSSAAGQPLPKKFYVHHMGGLPAGTGAIAWHFRNPELGSPATSNGGEFRDYALAPYEMNLTMDQAADLEIRRAIRIGVDGFAINAWASTQSAKDYMHALFRVAEAKNYPFEITISIDPVVLPPNNSVPNPYGGDFQAQVDAINYLLQHHGNSPKLARRAGKPLIMGYQSVWLGLHYALRETNYQYAWNDPQLRSTEWGWRLIGEGYRELQRQIGTPFYFQFDMSAFFHGTSTNGVHNPMAQAASILAEYVPAIGQFLPDQQTTPLGEAVRAKSIEWVQPLFFQYENYRNNAAMGGPGTAEFQRLWKQARDLNSTLIQYSTWNDYNETSHLAPGYNTRYAISDLSSYFIKWWKQGTPPAIDRDRIYIFSRKYPADAPVYPFQRPIYMTGAVEVTTLLTAPARIRVPGRGEYDAPAGLHTERFPVTVGTVSVELIRNGAVVRRLNHLEPVTDRPFRQDNSITAISTECERLWAEDFGSSVPFPRWSEYGDLDGDGLPNWFEMYWFGKYNDLRTAVAARPQDDPDGDGRNNWQEWLDRTNPKVGDSGAGNMTPIPAPVAQLPITEPHWTETVANQPPSVSLTSPLAGASFMAGQSISLAATATDADGSIAKVEFYAGTTLLGTVAAAPFAWTWSNPPTGTHALTARAYDNLAVQTTSGTVSVTVAPASSSTNLPAPWSLRLIGSPGSSAVASQQSGKFTLTGSGDDIYWTAENFPMIAQTVSGDLEITARVTSQQNTDPWAKAGVMIRETVGTGSRHAFSLVSPGNGTAFQRRPSTSGESHNTTGPAGTAPRWTRLTRVGNVFRSFVSSDGSNWNLVGEATIAMGTEVLVGMAMTSHVTAVAGTVEFDNVQVRPLASTGGAAPPPPLELRLLSLNLGQGQVAFEARAASSGVVRLESREDLRSGSWEVDRTGISLPANAWTRIEIPVSPAARQRFYRLALENP
jgi:regulation of enolase protein 1 (concanavalin A-like superfamily)